MRFVGYLIVALIGAVAASYWPLTPILPSKSTVVETLRDNAPFLADWLPEAEDAAPVEEAKVVPAEETVGNEPSGDARGGGDADSEIWQSFDLADITALLSEMGYQSELNEEGTEDPFLLVTSGAERSFIVQQRSCDDAGDCFGLGFLSVFDADMTPKEITALNDRYAYMKFYVDSEDDLILQKYITSDYGIARGNVRINLMVFMEILDGFEEALSEPTTPAETPAEIGDGAKN